MRIGHDTRPIVSYQVIRRIERIDGRPAVDLQSVTRALLGVNGTVSAGNTQDDPAFILLSAKTVSERLRQLGLVDSAMPHHSAISVLKHAEQARLHIARRAQSFRWLASGAGATSQEGPYNSFRAIFRPEQLTPGCVGYRYYGYGALATERRELSALLYPFSAATGQPIHTPRPELAIASGLGEFEIQQLLAEVPERELTLAPPEVVITEQSA